MNVEITGPKVLGYLFGNPNLPITETMRNAWIVMAFILFLCLFLTHRMQKIPKGKQALAEKAVVMIENLVITRWAAAAAHLRRILQRC